VNAGDHGRQLILTHTHAGVKALRQRLDKYKTPKNRFHLDTLAGWALNYAVHYPQLSGVQDKEPAGESWGAVYTGAARTLESSAVRRVVTESYAGLYVDEYQDCTATQHRLVLKLAELLPCRVVGDPLQGIFAFHDQPPVDWASDVEANFERLGELGHPWRWEKTNPALGRRLREIREALLAGDEIDLRLPPVEWCPLSPEAQRLACLDVAARGGSAVAIHRWAAACHRVASTLRGSFTSTEEMDCRDLQTWSRDIERSEGPRRASRVVEFATECMTVVGTELSTIRGRLADGGLPDMKRVKKHRDVAQALIDVAQTATPLPVLAALDAIERIPQKILYRRELWREMGRALRMQARTPGTTLPDAAWKVRNRTRQAGRPVEHRTVSRTLLVKGLEFEHVVVLNAGEHDVKNLYVAVTRGSKSLTVLSESPTIRPPASI
jgi:DNA helicase-2/ATP-dependent DNA helicase PcrA